MIYNDAAEADLARVQRIGLVGGLDIDVTGGMRARHSPEYMRVHGLSRGKLDETHAAWLARLHPDDREKAEGVLLAAVNGEAATYANEYRIIRPDDGVERWIEARADIYRDENGKALRLVGVHIDVTDRRKTEQLLRDSEARFRAFVTASSDVVYRMDPDWSHMRELRGRGVLTDTTISTADWRDEYILPDDRAAMDAAVRQAIESKAPFELEHRVRRADGSFGWTLTRAVPILDDAGAIVEWLGTARDVTAKREADERLRESEERQRLTVELVPAMLWRADPSGQEVTLNDRWKIYTGQSEEETQNFGWLSAIHPEDFAGTRTAFEQAFADGAPLERQQRIRRGDGEYRWHLVRHVPIHDETGAVIRWFGAAIDVHDLHQLQDHQSVLLAELQHRVRNTLAVIRSIARRTAAASESIEDYASELDGRLSAFARVQSAVTRNPMSGVNLEQLVVDELRAYATREGSQVRVSGPETRLQPKAAETLGLAFHELAVNALKHGALSTPKGRIRLTWRHDQHLSGERLHLVWKESGVTPATLTPERQGFGTDLLTRTLAYELKAQVTHVIEPDGVCFTMDMPLSGKVLVANRSSIDDTLAKASAPRRRGASTDTNSDGDYRSTTS